MPVDDRETDRMLDTARHYISNGRLLDARRALEIVIERSSESHAASEARRLLAPIYGSEERRAVETQGRQSGQGYVPAAGPSGWRDLPATATGAPQLPGPLNPGQTAGGETSRGQIGSDRSILPRQVLADARLLQSLEQEFRSTIGDRVFFGDASVDLGTKSRLVLRSQAAWLKRHPSLPITIEAHADDHGSRDFNDDLARRRGEAVRARLVEEGVEMEMIAIVVRGREVPIAPCAESACAAQNRRVVTTLGHRPGVQDKPSNVQPRNRR